jgi:hypothetical protein
LGGTDHDARYELLGAPGIGNETGRRGLFAHEALNKHTVVAWVPFSIAMCAANLTHTAVGKKVAGLRKDDVGFWANFQLAVWIAIEKKNDDSKWASFLDILPQEFDNQLTITPGAIKSRLNQGGYEQLGSKAVAQAAETKKMFKNAVNGLEKVGLGQNLTEKELKWALGVVWSRSFSMVNVAEQQTRSVGSKKPPTSDRYLIPFIDLINHGNETEANVVVAPPQGLPEQIMAAFRKAGARPPTEKFIAIVTTREIAEGEELLNNYGNFEDPDDLILSNLLRRGFVVPHPDAEELAKPKPRILFRGMKSDATDAPVSKPLK